MPRTLRALAAGAALLVVLVAPAHGQEPGQEPEVWEEGERGGEGARPAEAPRAPQELWQQQQALSAQYRELETKLRRLAVILQGLQPKQAARLRRAVAQSEEEQLLDGLMELSQRLLRDKRDLPAAMVTQAQVIEAMERVLAVLEQELADESLDPRELERMLREVKELRQAQERHLDATRKAAAADAQAKRLEAAIAEVDQLLERQRGVVEGVNAADPAQVGSQAAP
ncbi:MAG: hypothetical protein KIT58_12810, partial [Planctomycetota bacterium]|nr:hypothetical protein [Planctomycetota bacterium]